MQRKHGTGSFLHGAMSHVLDTLPQRCGVYVATTMQLMGSHSVRATFVRLWQLSGYGKNFPCQIWASCMHILSYVHAMCLYVARKHFFIATWRPESYKRCKNVLATYKLHRCDNAQVASLWQRIWLTPLNTERVPGICCSNATATKPLRVSQSLNRVHNLA